MPWRQVCSKTRGSHSSGQPTRKWTTRRSHSREETSEQLQGRGVGWGLEGSDTAEGGQPHTPAGLTETDCKRPKLASADGGAGGGAKDRSRSEGGQEGWVGEQGAAVARSAEPSSLWKRRANDILVMHEQATEDSPKRPHAALCH